MAKNPKGQPVTSSLLDRLLSTRRGKKTLRQVQQFLAIDLEDLLNTRCRCELLPESMEELETSMVNYGLPDFTGIKMSSAVERIRLKRLLEDTISRYESRLESVRVQIVENKRESDRRLHFQIEATFNAQPTPQTVVFDSTLEPNTATFEVK